MEPNPYLVASSILLSVPAIPLFMKNDYLGGGISVACALFSMLYHATKPRYPVLLLLDKTFAYSTCVYATFVCIKGLPYSIIPYSFLIGGAYTIYHVGYMYNWFLWHPNYYIATGWHTILHLGNSVMCTALVILS